MQTADDIDAGLGWLRGIEGVLGGAVVAGEMLGAWGEVELVKLGAGE